jgi:signal transduction histidine kinase
LDEQERILFAQSRFAAMGEMISMIAHQWRQPLTAIGMGANNLQLDLEIDQINIDKFKKSVEVIIKQVQFLSKTIDDFRNFLKSNNDAQKVVLSEVIDNALHIIGKSLENNNIAILKQIDCNIIVLANPNELIQALLAIINNAKDALSELKIKEPFIGIKLNNFDNVAEITIYDNGGGIPDDIKLKIFEPYFTTKLAKHGTGLGLYIAKLIIEKHHNGFLFEENLNNGACFTIKLPIFDVEN